MTATPTLPAQQSAPMAFLRNAEAWLDSKGRGAWIASMVIGFIVFWPIGAALLAYMLFAGKFARTDGASRPRAVRMNGSSGNATFDAYKADTLQRLQDEQDEFTAFLGRLRDAKDKAEFDQFMADRKPTATKTEDDDTAS